MRIIKYCILIGISVVLLSAQDNNLSNMYRLGKSFEQSGDYEKAMQMYEQIVELQPWNTTFLEALNETYIRLKEYDKSISLLNKRIEESPQNINFYGLLGDTYYTKGDTAKAYDVWNNALAAAANPVVGYRVIINYALQNRAFEKAIEFLREGQKTTGNNEVFALDLARVYSMTMNFDKAAVEFCSIIVDDPTKLNMVIGVMGQYLSRADAITQTINSVEEFEEENDAVVIDKLLIHLYKLNGDFEAAYKYVQLVEDEEDVDGKEFLKFAREALNEGEYDLASRSYKAIVDEYPNSPLVPLSRIGYANTYETSLDEKRSEQIPSWKPYSPPIIVFEKEYRDAIESYKKIIELYPNSDLKNEAYYSIANIYNTKLNKPDSAAMFYSEIFKSNLKSKFAVETGLKLAEIKIKNNELQKAKEELINLKNNVPLSETHQSELNLLLGRLSFWQNQFKESNEYLGAVTNNLFDDNANDALKLLTLINTTKKDSINLSKFASAELLIFQNNFEKADSIFVELSGSQNLIIAEFAKLRHAQVLIAQESFTPAIEVLNEASKLGMFAADAEYLKGEIKFHGLKDYEGALKSYRAVLENYSNSLYFDLSRQKIEYINELDNKSI